MMDSHKTEHFYLQAHVKAHLLMNMNFSKTDSQPCVKGSRSQWTTPEQQAESARAGPADTGGKWQYKYEGEDRKGPIDIHWQSLKNMDHGKTQKNMGYNPFNY